jgi:hypothetical protein
MAHEMQKFGEVDMLLFMADKRTVVEGRQFQSGVDCFYCAAARARARSVRNNE